MTDLKKLSEKIFKDGMTRLETVFNRQLSSEALKIYYEKLNNYPDEEFKTIIESIIEHDFYFPTIASFRKVEKESRWMDGLL